MSTTPATFTRRAALGHAGLSLLVLTGAGLATACKKDEAFTCTDTSGLSPEDVAARGNLSYSDTSTFDGKECSLCQQFVAPPSGKGCATCKVLKGPVHPKGYCKSFAAKT